MKCSTILSVFAVLQLAGCSEPTVNWQTEQFAISLPSSARVVRYDKGTPGKAVIEFPRGGVLSFDWLNADLSFEDAQQNARELLRGQEVTIERSTTRVGNGFEVAQFDGTHQERGPISYGLVLCNNSDTVIEIAFISKHKSTSKLLDKLTKTLSCL